MPLPGYCGESKVLEPTISPSLCDAPPLCNGDHSNLLTGSLGGFKDRAGGKPRCRRQSPPWSWGLFPLIPHRAPCGAVHAAPATWGSTSLRASALDDWGHGTPAAPPPPGEAYQGALGQHDSLRDFDTG